MAENNVIIRFDETSFEYLYQKPILDEVSFSIRKGSKITLMGQNGAGKSTIFKLLLGELTPKSGKINLEQGLKIGIAKQVVDRSDLELTVKQYFEKSFTDEVPYNVDAKIKEVLEAVNLVVKTEKQVKDLSGGQQARLLLAYALMQDPDILLLDEPTNNLDQTGIEHLVSFLIMHEKTVLVISHDANFLNCFTDGVIYLNVHTHKIEQYVGDYFSVVEEIQNRIERERSQNARLLKDIQDRKEKANFFSHKGGNLRALAKKLREQAEEDEEEMVEVRKDDRTIREFTIPVQEDIGGDIVVINSVGIMENHEPVEKKCNTTIQKRESLLIEGPNGIGKSTLLKSIVNKTAKGVVINSDVRIGYYSQDFSNLKFEQTVLESLKESARRGVNEEGVRSVASIFLINGAMMEHQISDLSEGQKGLLAFAKLVLEEPGLLICDEPTNHINFRHIPVIAKALSEFQGALIMVSHMQEFVNDVKIKRYLKLDKI